MAGRADIEAGRAFVRLFLKNELTSQLAGALRSASARLAAFGESAKAMGVSIAAIGAGAVVPLGMIAKRFADFDDQMRTVAGVTGATGADFRMLTDEAKRLGATTSYTAAEIAGLMVELGRAGFNPQEIMGATEAIQNLGRATATPLNEAAAIAGAALRQFNLPATQATRVADVLATTANSSAQTVKDLGEALSYVGPVAQDAGLSIEETGKALGVLANLGLKGSMGGTGLRRAILAFADPTAQKKLKALGVESVDAQGKLRPLAAVMIDLGKATAKMPNAQRLAFFQDVFDLRGMTAGLKLSSSVAEMEKMSAAIDNAAGRAKSTAAMMDSGLGGSIRIAMSAVEGLALEIGDTLSPVLMRAAKMLETASFAAIGWVKEHKGIVITAAAAAAGLVVAGAGLIGLGVAAKVGAVALGMTARAVSVVGAVVSGLGNTIALPFRLLGSAASAAARAIGSVFSRAVSLAKTSLAGMRSAAAWFTPIVVGASRAGAAIGRTLGATAVSALSAAGRRIGPALLAGVKGFPAAVRTAVTVASAYVTSFANGWTGTLALNVVRGGQMFNRLGAAAQSVFARIGQYGRVAWPLIVGAAQAAIPNVISAVQRLSTSAQQAWANISNQAEFAWRRIQWATAGAVMHVQGAVGTARAWITQQWDQASAAVGLRWQAAMGRVGSALSPVTGRIASVWSAMTARLQSAAGSSAGAIAGAYAKLPAWVRGPLGQLASMARADAGKIGSALSGAFSRVRVIARSVAGATVAAWRAIGPVASRGIVTAMSGAFSRVRSLAVRTGTLVGRLLSSPVTAGAKLGRGLGGAMGGLIGAASMLGAMGIGGALAPVLTMAPLVLGVLGSIGSAVAAVATPVGLLAAGVVAGAVAWVKFSENGKAAWEGLVAAVLPIVETLKGTFSAVKDAIVAGDWAMAGKLAMAGLKLAVFQGLGAIEKAFPNAFATILRTVGKIGDGLVTAWGKVTGFLTDQWNNWGKATLDTIVEVAGLIPDIWQQAVENMANWMLAQSAQGGVMGKMWSQLLGVDMADEQAKAQAMEEARRPALKRNLEWAIEQAKKEGRDTTQLEADLAALGGPQQKVDVLADARQAVKAYTDQLRSDLANAGSTAGEGPVSQALDSFLTKLESGLSVADAQAELDALKAELAATKEAKTTEAVAAAGTAGGTAAAGSPSAPAADATAVPRGIALGPTYSAAAAQAAGQMGSGASPQEKMATSIYEMAKILREVGLLTRQQTVSNAHVVTMYERFLAAMTYG